MNKIKKPSFTLNYPWLQSNDRHFVKCCLCQGKNKTIDRFVFKINSEIFKIRHCVADNLLYLFPQPGVKYFNNLYNHPSYFKGEDDMYGLAVNDEKSTRIAKIRIEEILKYKKKPNSILEIGCAYGHTLLAAKSAGLKIADGIEFSKDAVAACRQKGLRVFLSSPNVFSLTKIKKNRYDVIAMYSVLEHVQNPLTFLEKIVPLLAIRGVIVIRVPEMSAKGPWLSLVDHTWHFTRKSIKKIMGEINLSIINIFPSGKFIGIQHKGELASMTIVAKRNK